MAIGIHHILQETDTIRFDLVPSCVFTFPEVASIGMTEEAKKKDSISLLEKLLSSQWKSCIDE